MFQGVRADICVFLKQLAENLPLFSFFRRRSILRLSLRIFWRVLFFTRNVPPLCSCEFVNTLNSCERHG